MDLPCLKNARRIFAIVSTTSIPTSASKNHGSQCGPSVPGSRLEADHPEKGVLFACRFTPWPALRPQLPQRQQLKQANFGARSHDANRAYDPAARRGLMSCEHVLDAGANFASVVVGI